MKISKNFKKDFENVLSPSDENLPNQFPLVMRKRITGFQHLVNFFLDKKQIYIYIYFFFIENNNTGIVI